MRESPRFAARTVLALALAQCLSACSSSGDSNLFSGTSSSGGSQGGAGASGGHTSSGGLTSGGAAASGAGTTGGAGGSTVGAAGSSAAGGTPSGGMGGGNVAGAGGMPSGGASGAESGGSGGAGTGGGSGAAGGSGSGGGGSVLLISQIETRGLAGAADEFIEIYNPTDAAVTFDSSWSIMGRGAVTTVAACESVAVGPRYTGNGQSIPSHGHLLVTGSMYGGTAVSDGQLLVTVQDAGSLFLTHNASVIDAVCFYYSPVTQAVLETCPTAYTCEGNPVSNLPHDNTAAGNVDESIERRPGGLAGNATDVNDNASDFQTQAPSEPRGLASPPTP
ncbi:MAG TPA: lamin tail domain-containing protein [Polyangiaceae bacterium]|jgi:hypothetical protein|nr:lamin tail domain-containing protein [Polyangiaceae bacterium]